MKNYSLSSSFCTNRDFFRLFFFILLRNILEAATIAKIILIKVVKFYDLISIIFKRELLVRICSTPLSNGIKL